MIRQTKVPAVVIILGGTILLMTGGCASKGDARAANAPVVNTSAPVPANAPPGVAASIQASQAQGAAMASKSAADGAAYKRAREQAGN